MTECRRTDGHSWISNPIRRLIHGLLRQPIVLPVRNLLLGILDGQDGHVVIPRRTGNLLVNNLLLWLLTVINGRVSVLLCRWTGAHVDGMSRRHDLGRNAQTLRRLLVLLRASVVRRRLV